MPVTIEVQDETGGTTVVDVVPWHGKLWFVPFWLNAGDGLCRPSRMIRFDNLSYSSIDGQRLVLHEPLPRPVERGNRVGFEEVDFPEVFRPMAA